MAEVNDNSSIQLFEDQKIRTAWDAEKEEWYFAIVDVIAVLTDSADPQNYWRVLKKRLKDEGNETITNCNGLKMTAPDGKKRKTDVANTEQLLRIIQSIPSPKAEPFKAWLAMVGKERIEETIDPEQAIDRALDTYLKKGYSEEWIHQRLLAIRIRNELTDEWKKCGVQKGREYAILTDEISRAWSGMTTGQYKQLKGLTKENLRDNMTDLELVLTMLAEASTTDISKTAKPQTFEENKQVAKRGGKVAGIARQALEAETGKPVITEKNAFDFQQLVTDIVEDAAELPEQSTEKKKKIIRLGGFNMKVTEPYNLGLLALISEAGEISCEELKQRYLPPEQPGVIQGVAASFDNDIKALEKEKYISVRGNIIRFIRK